jgi:hypothetical protein
MENRSVRYQERQQLVFCQTSTDEIVRETSLNEAEVRSLLQLFELLDRWDREVVQ